MKFDNVSSLKSTVKISEAPLVPEFPSQLSSPQHSLIGLGIYNTTLSPFGLSEPWTRWSVAVTWAPAATTAGSVCQSLCKWEWATKDQLQVAGDLGISLSWRWYVGPEKLLSCIWVFPRGIFILLRLSQLENCVVVG